VDDDIKKMFKTLGYLSTVGMSMAFAVGLGALIGHYLDEKFDTTPWLFFVFLIFGILAAFRNLQLMYKKLKRM
jgi:ATP synthase protein I